MKAIKRIIVISLFCVGMSPLQASAWKYNVISPGDDKNFSEVIPEGQSPQGVSILIRIENKYDTASLNCEYEIWKKVTVRKDQPQSNEKISKGHLSVVGIGGAFTNYENMYWHYGEKYLKLFKSGDYMLYTRCYVIPASDVQWSQLWTPSWSQWSQPRKFHVVHIPTTSKDPVIGQKSSGAMMSDPGSSKKDASLVKEPIKAPSPTPPVVFGSKARAVPEAAALQPETLYAPPLTVTSPVASVPALQMGTSPEVQPIGDLSRPMSGQAPGGLSPATKGIIDDNRPVPAMTAPALGRLPPAMKGMPPMQPMSGPPPSGMPQAKLQTPPRTLSKVPTIQPAPVTVPRQLTPAGKATDKPPTILSTPTISYPGNRQIFPAPASFTVRANYAKGHTMEYIVKRVSDGRNVQKNTTGRFSNLPAGNYCVYVAYKPKGPASRCVGFVAMERRAVTAPIEPAKKPVATPPAPVQKMQPAPVQRTPGG